MITKSQVGDIIDIIYMYDFYILKDSEEAIISAEFCYLQGKFLY